jgi:predicted transposase/invertase (TIGR01784 family)
MANFAAVPRRFGHNQHHANTRPEKPPVQGFLLMRRFPKLDREEVRAMFQLEDFRKTRVWQEAHEEGRAEGREEGREERAEELVHKWLAKGMTIKEIAALLDTSVQEVRRLSKNGRR